MNSNVKFLIFSLVVANGGTLAGYFIGRAEAQQVETWSPDGGAQWLSTCSYPNGDGTLRCSQCFQVYSDQGHSRPVECVPCSTDNATAKLDSKGALMKGVISDAGY